MFVKKALGDLDLYGAWARRKYVLYKFSQESHNSLQKTV